jgi:PAS domain S-box-containing protein
MNYFLDSFAKKILFNYTFATVLILLSIPVVLFLPALYPIIALFVLLSIIYTHKMVEKREDDLTKALQTSPILIYVISLETEKIKYINSESKRILGYKPDELLAIESGFLKIFANIEDNEAIEKSKRILSLLNEGEYFDLNFSLKNKEGKYVFLKNRFAPYKKDPQGKTIEVISFSEDISEQTALEKEIETEKLKAIHNEKFAALGEMAGGIAHEINNPLAIIIGHAQHLKIKVSNGSLKEDDILKAVDKIESTTKRISKIVHSLRMLAQDGLDDEFSMVSVKVFEEDIRSFWEQRLNNSQIKLIIENEDQNLAAFCKPVQIVLILLNLIGNSYHAIKSSKDDKWIKIRFFSDKDNFKISITDSGKGIPEVIRSKIFNPFFTTKDAGEGTGLGLSIASGIAKVNKGQLYLDESCANTCFILSLPLNSETNKIAS